MSDLIRIDFEHGQLKTQLHTYRITESLPVDKYIQFLNLQNEIVYGLSFEETRLKIRDAKAAMNKLDFVRAAVILDNLDNALNLAEKRRLPILRLCALFLIREGEDATVYDETICNEKVDEFTNGGIDFKDFFHLAALVVPGLLTALNEISRTISQAEAEISRAAKELQKNTSGNRKSKTRGNGSKRK